MSRPSKYPEETAPLMTHWQMDLPTTHVERHTTADGHVVIIEEMGPCEFDNDRNVWERQAEEPSAQWAAFKVYRDMMPNARSAAATERRLRENPELEQIVGRVQKLGRAALVLPMQASPWNCRHWANQWRWRERVVAYDNWRDARELQLLERRRIRVRGEHADLGEELRNKAAEALAALEAVIKLTRIVDGKKITKTVSALSPSAITKLVETGARLERLALGESTENIASRSHSVVIHTTIDDAELIERAKAVMEGRVHAPAPTSNR